MDNPEDLPDGEAGDEVPSSTEDQCERVELVSIGMLLVRSSLAGDSPCINPLDALWYSRFYDAYEDAYLINLN